MPANPDAPESTADLSLPVVRVPPTVEIHDGQGVQTGNHNTQNNTFVKALLPAMESTPALPGLSRIPAEMPLFVGRSGELDQIDRALEGSGRAAVVAVHGLGGVGKSTLAAQFVRLNAGRFGFCWWITADSPTAIDTGLADLAVAVVPETAELPVEQRSDLGIRWLATHDDWLLVLDNVTSPDHASSLLERVRTGNVIMTSRQATGWSQVASVRLDVLTPDDALDLLTRTVRVDWPDAVPGGLADAARLCDELGYLPLAIEQAGAYIAHTRITAVRYLELLERFPVRMFTATAEGGDAQRTMARVWHVTLDRLISTPLAVQLLRQLAWYAPDNIPRALVESPDQGPEVGEALGRLAAYNMITLTADTISVHRLVQAVTRTPDPDDPHRQPDDITRARDTTATALAHHIAGDDSRLPTVWPRYQTVLPHALALLNHAPPRADTELHCVLANEFGIYLRGQGNLSTAIPLLTRATASYSRLHGPDHPHTLLSRNNLAGVHQAAGDLGRAISLYEATLVDMKRVLGADHPDTLLARNNLAGAYQTAGDLERAIPLHEAALADRERVQGANHPDTLLSRNNLAYVYQAAGDLGRAISLYEATLVDMKRVLGADHPDTLLARNNLAGAYQTAGDLERAIPLHEAILADRERVLGADHPDTLTSRNNLASAYQTAGDLERAIPLHEAIHADRERVQGADHPDTLLARINLAGAYQTAGDLKRAIPLYEATLTSSERVLGADHPNTLTLWNNLASAYQTAGDLKRAIPLYEATLTSSERVLGADHPDTLLSRINLAYVYRAAGDLGRAIPLYEAILADFERVLGADHPSTKAIHSDVQALDEQR